MTDILSLKDDSREIPEEVQHLANISEQSVSMRRTLITLSRLFAFCLFLMAVAEFAQAKFALAMPATVGAASNASGILIGAVLTAAGVEHYSKGNKQ